MLTNKNNERLSFFKKATYLFNFLISSIFLLKKREIYIKLHPIHRATAAVPAAASDAVSQQSTPRANRRIQIP